MFYEPEKGHGLPHDPFKAIVAPRPIGWISTRSRAGAVNIGPYSFFNAISVDPFLVYFSSQGEKDSVAFARETGEFVVNLAGRALARQMNASSVDAPRGVSEFDYAGLTPVASTLVSAPRAAEAHAALECKVTEIREAKDLKGRATYIVVTGEVVGVYIDDEMLTDGLFDAVRAGNLARLGYFDFSATDETFPMRRPKWTDGG